MRSLSILCLLLITSSSFPSHSAQSPTTSPSPNKETATVAGNVLRLDTGEALKKARVSLHASGINGVSLYCLTDEQGHFLIEDIPAGSYYLMVSRNGYVDAEYGQKTVNGRGAILTLTAGQRMTDLVFKLARSAVISGHVFDEDGEPVPGAEVMTYRASKKPGNEERNYDQVTTNDLGEFRVFDLPPGRYYIAVNFRHESPHSIPTAPKQKSEPGYLPSYYPNTTDTSKAEAISVGPGDEIRAVDFFLRPSHMVTVSGRMISTGAVPPSAWGTIWLRPRGSGLAQALHGIDDNFQMKDGSFVIPNVPPGSYVLGANWMDRETREMHTARRQLDVGNSDLEGVTLVISRGADIPGRVIWEGASASDFDELYINLEAVGDEESGVPSQMAKQDGTFRFKNIPEGTYRPAIFARGMRGKFFLKSARYGTTAVGDAGFAVQPGAELSLELTLSSRAPQLTGVILNADSLPAVGATVVLVPDPPHRDAQHKYETAVTDQNGKFTMTGITPGDYKLFSWETTEDSDADWVDPEWLKPYETKGESIHLDEADKKSVSLTLIETRTDSPAAN
jgi:Carboxypeptidase regulatory-like domain